MNVEDIASQISVIFGMQRDQRDQISGVHVSPGSAETLARGGKITNDRLIAYSLSNIFAKDYKNRLICVEVIVCYISAVFTARGYAKRGICRRRVSVCVSVCLCVCLSHSGIVSKRLYVGSHKQRRMIDP